jgi:hypothetical protein
MPPLNLVSWTIMKKSQRLRAAASLAASSK